MGEGGQTTDLLDTQGAYRHWRFWGDRKPETQKVLPRQPVLTLVGATPTPKLAAGGMSGHFPKEFCIVRFNTAPMNQEAQAMDHSVSGEEGLIHSNHPALYTCGFQTSINFPLQASGFGYFSALGHAPSKYQQRQEFIGDARTWEDLDTPIWKKEEGEEEEWDAVEAYFAYLYRPLAGR
ncbi:hypothetical protein EV426DRAFT_707263 [Tirmania nivea]|nr:hypothetical protein EV426DRAFT_707263 [Tirmania nivea]